MIPTTTDVVTSFTDSEGNEMIITGKEAYLTEFNVHYPSSNFQDISTLNGVIRKELAPEPITINLEFKLPQNDSKGNANYIIESFYNGFKPKRQISKIRVDDCSINELLFAVRQKVKEKSL